jgi:hypothetical protein
MVKFEITGPIPAGAGPLERLAAPGFKGSIADDPLKSQFVAAAERTALSVEGVRRELSAIGWGVDTIADAVTSLESQLVPRFDSQVELLGQQLSILHSIDASLKSPNRIQAAERIQQTAPLLKAGFYERALQYAHDALRHDATNPAGYIAAAWALIGKGNIVGSTDYFADASRIAKDYQTWFESMRQLAKCQLAIGDTHWAKENLSRAINRVNNKIDSQSQHILSIEGSADEHILIQAAAILEGFKSDLAILHYEASIAATADGDYQAATEYIGKAVEFDLRFAQLVVGEPMLEGHVPVISHALSVARGIEDARRLQQKWAEAEERERAREERRRQREQAKRDEIARQEAALQNLLNLIDKYNSTIRALYPWSPGQQPRWMKKIEGSGGQKIPELADKVKEALSKLKVHPETKSYEELRELLIAVESVLFPLAQEWANYVPRNIFTSVYTAERDRIRKTAKDLLAWRENSKKRPSK